MHRLNGNQIAATLRADLKKKVSSMQPKPGLAAILVGDDPGSHTYVSLKEKACNEAGINFFRHELSDTITTEKLINLIKELNSDSNVHGILVQLPLPKSIDTDAVIQAINPLKDVDGFHQESIRELEQGTQKIISPVYAGVLRLLEETGKQLSGMSAAILANSEKFARPLEFVLQNHNISSTSLIKSENFSATTQSADIVIVAVGKAHLLTAKDIKKDAILIDIGFNRINGKVVGDIDEQSVAEKAAFLSPVPGGVGPMTVAYLLNNVVQLSQH